MNNNLDKQYTELLQDILENGITKNDRTGTGTISVFGRQIRHKMSEGFPLLTTKKMYWKGIVTELLWFLRGDTNIKFLLDNDCHIWDGDAYKFYEKWVSKTGCLINIKYPDVKLSKEEFINKIKTDDTFAKEWGDLGRIYGAQWRDWSVPRNDNHYFDQTKLNELEDIGEDPEYFHFDQIQNLINELKTNPDSRRMIVSAWNVGCLDSMVLPPCHYGFQCYTRELSHQERSDLKNQGKKYGKPANGKLIDERLLDSNNVPKRAISLMWNQRSVDTPLGLPFNIASYGLLLSIIAEIVNMVPDELIGNLGDTHIYLNQIDGVKEQIGREPYNLPTLNINTEHWPRESEDGPIDAIKVFDSFTNEHFCKCLIEDDIQLVNYQSHPTIKMPLSN